MITRITSKSIDGQRPTVGHRPMVIARRSVTVRSLFLTSILGLTGLAIALPLVPSLLSPLLPLQAIPPRPELPTRQDIRLTRQAGESYRSFLRRSEVIARAAIQRHFDRNVQAKPIVVYLVGLHHGNEAPVMSVEVSRDQWQRHPDAKRWATYYRMSKILLGFGNDPGPEPITGPTAQPGVMPIAPIDPFSTPFNVPVTAPAPSATASPASSTAPSPSPTTPPESPNKG